MAKGTDKATGKDRGRAKPVRVYEGRNLWAVKSPGIESLATHILDASHTASRRGDLALRGVENDAEAVVRFACSRRFWTASAMVSQDAARRSGA